MMKYEITSSRMIPPVRKYEVFLDNFFGLVGEQDIKKAEEPTPANV